MSIFNGLFIGIFLLLLAASAAVVGSMVVLAIFDLVFRRKHPSATTEATNSNSEIADSYQLEAVYRGRVASRLPSLSRSVSTPIFPLVIMSFPQRLRPRTNRWTNGG